MMNCKTIAIMSFKGGVGKSVSTINLGAALVSFGKKVLIIDGNFLSPSLHFYLGLLKPEVTLKDVIRNNLGPHNAIYEHKSGINLMPCSFYKNVNLHRFRELVDRLRDNYDYIIIDSGPSYTEELIAILAVSDDVLFVTTPDYPTLAATVKASKFTKFKDMNVLGIVTNRRKRKSYELSKKDIGETAKLPVICEIEEDNKMMSALSKFVPVVWKYKKSKSAKSYLRLAKNIIDKN